MSAKCRYFYAFPKKAVTECIYIYNLGLPSASMREERGRHWRGIEAAAGSSSSMIPYIVRLEL